MTLTILICIMITQSEQTQGPVNHSDDKLARDRARIIIRPPQKFGYADLTAYAFSAATDLDEEEHIDYNQSVTCKEMVEWIKAMGKEIRSLEKNHT